MFPYIQDAASLNLFAYNALHVTVTVQIAFPVFFRFSPE